MSFDCDYVVVGSGFGGSVSALRLAERGYSVAVLEMGKRYRTGDFARTNWSLRRFFWMPKLLLHGIQSLTLLRDVFVLHGVGVGGGSLVYANTLLTPPDAFFRDPQWAEMANWREVLAPHYETARRMLGARPAPELQPADRLLREVALEMGRGETFHPVDVGVYFGQPGKRVADPYFGGLGPERAGCTRCGACMVGCNVGAKNTLDKNYLYLAEQLGARIVPETRVIDLLPLDAGGYAVVTETSTRLVRRQRRTFRARRVVLAAGVLGTVKLLLDARARGRLPHLSPRLGDLVRTNSEALVGVSARDDRVDYSKGIAITSGFFPDDRTHVEVVRYNDGSDAMAWLATVLVDGGGRLPRPLRWLLTVLARPLEFLRLLNPVGWARRTAILLVMQPIDNALRLVLRPSRFSRRRSRLDSDVPAERRAPVYLPVANEIARRMADKMHGIPQSGLAEVLLNVSTTAHLLGGCSIGPDAERGVIDGACRVYGAEGLYVVDGSALPANLGVNPSLTITALAEHAMSRIPPRGAGPDA